MTRDDVLRVIRDAYRFGDLLYPEAVEGFDLTFDTTVMAWREACDLVAAFELGYALNAWFGVYFGSWEWSTVLEPADRVTLRGVCELIASKAKVPDIRPILVCGSECLSAGVFLTIRTALRKEGIPVAGIRPSTRIAPVARKHLQAFITALGIVAPSVLPVPELKEKPVYRVGLWLAGAGLVSILLSLFMRSSALAFSGLASELMGFLVLLRLGAERFKSVSFREVETFRDLTEAVIRHAPLSPVAKD
jgi:hypothetical protein